LTPALAARYCLVKPACRHRIRPPVGYARLLFWAAGGP